MILPVEDRWGVLSVLEHEHGAKKALLSLFRKDELDSKLIQSVDQETFLEEVASSYAAHGFRQGKEFFRHAETSSWLAKPLLLYYGMLTVVKSGLVFKFPDFFRDEKNLLHGISAGDRVKTEVDFQKEYVEIHKGGVHPLARNALEHALFSEGTKITLHEILTRLPEVDATYRFVCQSQTASIDCVKIWGSVIYRDAADNLVRIGFQLPQDVFDPVKVRLPTEITENFEITTASESGQTIAKFRSKQTWDNEISALAGMPDSLTSTLDQNFALVLPIEISGKTYQVTELELMYLIIFDLSSLARYQPHLWVALQAGAADLNVLLCQDILRSCENKFLSLVQKELYYAGLLPLIEGVHARKPEKPPVS